MIEVLQFYVSGFWVWLGITAGLGMVVQFCLVMFAIFMGAITGTTSKPDKERTNL
jgi:hypothetical protein